MATWLRNELPEEWPQQNLTSNSDNSAQSNHSSAQIGQTVAIQPEKATDAQWKQAISPAKPNADHLNGLFEGESEFPIDQDLQETSASGSDLSSVAEQTRRLKLFTQTKNTYTNQRLDALATSLQGHHQSDEDKSDIIGNLMNDGNNALSRIRKASNMELRAIYENSKEDSSLDDLNNLHEPSNGSTLSSLTDHNNTTTNSKFEQQQQLQRQIQHQNQTKQQTRPAKSMESINPTVRFKTPSHTPARAAVELQEPEIPSLAIPESFDLEEKPFMSFVHNDFDQHQPLTTSASETSGTAIRPPARQVRRETMIHSRPASSASQSIDPRPQAIQQHQQQQAQGTVRHHPSRGSTWSSVRSAINSRPNISLNGSIDKVFDVSVAVNSVPLRDMSIPNLDEKNSSIARKNVSFSGSLYQIVQQVRGVDHSNIDFEVDLARMNLECLRGLDELLPNLAKVDLAHNKIQVVDGLPPSLLELDLSHNALNRMTVFPLMFLTDLSIAHNQLQDLTCLRQLRALSQLDVSNNKLKSLKGIEALYSLETLNIGENQLRSIKIAHPKLRHLRAANNHIDAVDLDTPRLETLDVSNNSILALDPIPSVRKLYINNNHAKMNFNGWESLEELYYNGNNMASDFNCVSPLVLAWTGTNTGFDINSLNSCQVLSINNRDTLKLLSKTMLSIQQLDLTGMGLKSLPSWLPRCMPNLRCLNLAFNQLDDKALQVVSELKELRTLGLFGNQISSVSSVTLCLGKLGKLGALDLRGNPVTNALYPDMKTLLLDASNGTQGEQYDRLLQIDWRMVLDEWQLEPSVSQKFNEYNKRMKQLKLWWLDGAIINDKPSNQRIWKCTRAIGLGAIRATAQEASPQWILQETMEEEEQVTANQTPVADANSTTYSAGDETTQDSQEYEVDPSQPNVTQDYDIRHHFPTPSRTHFATPSRVNGEISTIGKAKAQVAKATHSTPAPVPGPTATSAHFKPSAQATPQTMRKPSISRPLAKSMARARKTPVSSVKQHTFSNNLLASLQNSTNDLNAKLTAEFIVSICRREYDSKR